jgi:peroxidase
MSADTTSGQPPAGHPDVGDDLSQAAAARCPFLAKLEQMPRLTEARYEDALGALYEGTDPMEVASRLFDQDGDTPNEAGASALFTTWGQFIDHDLSLTPEGEAEVMENPAFAHGLGRSDPMEGTGEEGGGPRQFGNAISWQMDASAVYGSNAGREADLRAFEGGKLAMTDDPASTHGLLPVATPETVMAGETEGPDAVFLAGDVRANENPNLLAMHTLMAREHNHWAERLAEEHPDWDDEALFQGARQLTEHTIQKITYDEWLPLLLGNAAPSMDAEYDEDADGQVALEFSTAAFRFGHTLVASRMERVEDDGTESPEGHMALMDGFFDVSAVKGGGIDDFLRGMTQQSAEALDTKVVDDLNFFLQTPEGVSGFSLPAINLMRSADHGMGSYVDVRAELLGDIDPDALDPTDFSIVTSDADLQAELAAVYDSVHDVELWVGGLAEDAAPGAMLGPLFSHIVSDQFERTATADPTFGDLDPALGTQILAEAAETTMAEVILRNTHIDSLQEDAFLWESRALVEAVGLEGSWDADRLDLDGVRIDGDLDAGGGDDVVTVTGGTRVTGDVTLGEGDDSLTATSGSIGAVGTGGGAGDDAVAVAGTATVGTVLLGEGDDTLDLGEMGRVGQIGLGAGDDVARLDGKASADALAAGRGDDRLELGEDATLGRAGMGRGDDVVRLTGDGLDFVDGGAGRDTLEIGTGAKVFFDDGTREDGFVSFEDGGVTRFENFERVIPCFTPGTRLVTAAGRRDVADLRPGARVWTLDRGLRPVRWVGRVTVPAAGALAPVAIAAGALGNDRATEVSPQHRLLIASALSELWFGAAEVLAPAAALVGLPGVTRRAGGTVTYVHLLFDAHEIVLADGIPSESFHPGPAVLSSMDRASRGELLALFPDLERGYGPDARPAVRGREARALAAALR